VTSSLPEKGKTTTLCNLAIALSSADSRVLIIKADLLGLERLVGLTSILAGRVRSRSRLPEYRDAGEPTARRLFAAERFPPSQAVPWAAVRPKFLLILLLTEYVQVTQGDAITRR